jgi:RHS repeat-associated protein
MRSILFALFTLFAFANEEIGLIPSSPDQIASLNYDSDFLIGGCVHPASGQLSLSSIDLIAKGAQELRLFRVYIPPAIVLPRIEHSEMQTYYNERSFLRTLQKNHRGWVFLPHLKLERKSTETKVPDSNGAIYSFSRGKLIDKAGISNTLGDIPSGKNDPRNIQIIEETDVIIILLPSGTKRFYNQDEGIFYHLTKEILPNGRVIKYSYSRNQILIQSFDPTEKHLYASLQLDTISYKNSFYMFDKTEKGSCGKYETQKGEKEWRSTGAPYLAVQTAQTNTGLTATYKYDSTDLSKEISKKCGTFRHELSFIPHLKTASTPFYRNETFEYENYLPKTHLGKSVFVQASYEGTPLHIEALYFPNGPNDTLIPLYRLDVQTSITTAIHQDGCKTVYAFSPQRLPLSIQSIGANGKVSKIKMYHWDSENRLSSIEWKDGEGHTFYKRSYEDYDPFNNPQKEIFSGNLTGANDNESYTISRLYSKDGRNLLLQEATEEGLKTTFEYFENTDLLKRKLIVGKEIFISESYEYENHCLTKKVVEDGNQKLTTLYTLRQEQPFLHMPEWIEERSATSLIKKVKLSYDLHGNVSQEDIYGSDGKFAYSLLRSYDEAGNLLSETNPLGYIATSTYDPKGLLDESKNFSEQLTTKRIYDKASRLKKIIQTGEEIEHTTLYDYNAMGRLEKKRDPLGNITHYLAYGGISNQPTQIEYPSSALWKKSYDGFGRLIEKIDPNQHPKRYKYNAYGSVTEIIHPNGAKETFLYAKNGALSSHTDLNGLTTVYSHDALQRITEKRYLFEGKELAKETFSYDSFHLLSHTDKEGHVTRYEYDSAGRKIEETRAGRVIKFEYDALGRLFKEKYENGLHILSHFDVAGNLQEKEKTDASGKVFYRVSYTYNADGDQESVTHYPNQGSAKITFSYDPLSRLKKVTDPDGFHTLITYDESNQALTKTITDPNGISTLIVYDPYNREIFRKISNLRTEERIYDLVGNLLQIKEDSRITRYAYNSLNLPITLTRAYNSPEARTTRYDYTFSGLLKTKTEPNGTILHYTYDPFSHPKTVASADGSLSHHFVYNSNGILLRASDPHHTIERIPDPFGNTLQEIIDQKLTLTKTYDALNRPLTLTLPDRSSIRYTYNPVYLETVDRLSPSQDILYTHTYESYDLSGNLLQESLPFHLGKQTRSYDQNRRLKELSSPYFSQTLSYDPGGRLTYISAQGTFTYDDLDQLTSEPNHTYTYDSRYNRITKNQEAHPHNHLDELASLDYDFNGNLTQKNTFTLHYDPLNRLIEAENEEQSLHFTYDPLSRRLTKSSNTLELYLYDGSQEIASLHPTGEIKDVFVPGLHHCPIAIELQGDLFIPITDYRNSTRRLLNRHGFTRQTYEYTAFGEETTSLREPFNPWRYASRRFDPELGLYSIGKRSYDPSLGIWISPDPAGFIDGTNLYTYLHNDPLGRYDPNGEWAIPLFSLSWGASTAILSNPIGWAVGGALVAGTVIYWATDKLVASGQISPTTGQSMNGLLGGIAGSMIQSIDFNLPLSSMPQITSTGYGGMFILDKNQNVFVKNNSDSQNSDKQSPRTEPKNLEEQLALEEAKNGAGKEIEKLKDKIKDPKYPKEIWEKKQHLHEDSNGKNINIHYWENRASKERKGFKFKND